VAPLILSLGESTLQKTIPPSLENQLCRLFAQLGRVDHRRTTRVSL
jgi:hypothetical protein